MRDAANEQEKRSLVDELLAERRAEALRELPAARRQEPRIVARYEPTRRCECGSVDLALVDYGDDHWRKECATCGSTGPFAPIEGHADPASIYTGSPGAQRARRRLGF